MSWLDDVTTERVVPSVRRHDDSSRVRPTLTYNVDDTVSARYNGYTFEYAHRTKFMVQTIWYANEMQFEDRQQAAERAILEAVFEPYTKYRLRLIHAVMDRDTEEAVRLLGLIDKEIGL